MSEQIIYDLHGKVACSMSFSVKMHNIQFFPSPISLNPDYKSIKKTKRFCVQTLDLIIKFYIITFGTSKGHLKFIANITCIRKRSI